jgi:hypothetical protein
MRTYPHVRDDGTIAYFEISNAFPWSLGFMRRVLTSVEGVSGFRRERNSDDRFCFVYVGRRCVVHEPFGDNSRYWIGPAEPEPPIDMTVMRDAFTRFRFRLTLDRDFNSSASKTTTAAALQAALPRAIEALATLRSAKEPRIGFADRGANVRARTIGIQQSRGPRLSSNDSRNLPRS